MDWSRLKAFADNKSNVTKKLKFVLERVENIVGKEKMLVISIFSFSNNVFKRLFFFFFLGPWPFPKQQFFDSSKLKESADNNFEFDENGRKFS